MIHPPHSTAPESTGGQFNMDWSDRFALGIELIDQQHKVLFRLIDQLARAIQDETSEAELQTIFAELHDYTRTHFATEERLMAQYAYPADQDHHASHRALEHTLEQLVERAKSGEPLVSIQTMNFLRLWLYNHIDGTDRQFADFLKAKGVTTVSTVAA
jgi:hemerythrin-like metal-binding protein